MGVPFQYKVYSLFRRLIFPRRITWKFEIVTLVLVGALLAAPFVYFFEGYIYAASIFAFYVLTAFLHIELAENGNHDSEQHVTQVPFSFLLLILLLVGVWGFVIVRYLGPFPQEIVSMVPSYIRSLETLHPLAFDIALRSSPLLLSLFFWVELAVRHRRYKGERKYYSNEYAQEAGRWREASAAMELGHKFRKSNKGRKSYYYFDTARRKYHWLSENASREVYKKAASLHENAAEQYIQSVSSTDSRNKEKFFRKGNESIEKSNQILDWRICDGCGEKIHIKQAYRNISNGVEQSIYCPDCYGGVPEGLFGESRTGGDWGELLKEEEETDQTQPGVELDETIPQEVEQPTYTETPSSETEEIDFDEVMSEVEETEEETEEPEEEVEEEPKETEEPEKPEEEEPEETEEEVEEPEEEEPKETEEPEKPEEEPEETEEEEEKTDEQKLEEEIDETDIGGMGEAVTSGQHEEPQISGEDQEVESVKPEREFSKTGSVTVEWSKEVLQIEEPLNREKVKEAFRREAAEYHPDKRGNYEDFQKIQDARDRLIKYIKYKQNE